MSLLFDDRPVPTHVRTRIGVPLPKISFGAPEPLSGPGQYNYEVSPEDRAMIDQVIRDNQSPDELRKKAALEAWSNALWNVAPQLGPLMLAAGTASLILDFLGKRVLQPFDLGPMSGVLHIKTGDWSAVLTEFSVGMPYASGTSNYVDVQIGVAATLLNWNSTYYNATDQTSFDFVNVGSGVEVGPSGGGSWVSRSGEKEVGSSGIVAATTRSALVPGNRTSENPSTIGEGEWKTCSGMLPNRNSFSYTDTYSTGSNASPCYKAYLSGPDGNVYTQEICAGESLDVQMPELGPPSDLGGIPDPADLPFDENDMEELIRELTESPWWEKYKDPTPELPGEPHPKDPNWPCNPGSGGVEVPRVRVGGPGMSVPRGPGFNPPGKPGDEMCVVVGGKRRCGKIRRMPPPGEDIIIEEPPYRDERFTKHWCPKKGRLIVDLVKQLAGELGFNPGESGWIVDTDCKKRWPGGCFAKGSSKFKAMWALADMCGDIFGREPPHIGKIKPFPPDPRTYGPYHEYRDLFVFEATQDDLDTPSHVEVYVPHFRNQRGYSVVVEVDTPYDLKDKWLRIRAPKNMSEADAMDWAAK